jgi:prepilin-type N-terminal cleavage/methylation domain-containing protein
MQGFSLIELLIATLVLTYGLLAAGQLISASLGSASLCQAKETASVMVRSKIESLMALYRHNPNSPDLMPGSHGPEQVEIINPLDGKILNKYESSWLVANLPDPSPGIAIPARLIVATARPVDSAGSPNFKAPLNKAISVSTIVSRQLEWPR